MLIKLSQQEFSQLFTMLQQLAQRSGNFLLDESSYTNHAQAIAVLLNLIVSRHDFETDFPLFFCVQLNLNNEFKITSSTSDVFIGYSNFEIKGRSFKSFVAAASFQSLPIIEKQISLEFSYYALLFCVDGSSMVLPLFCDICKDTITAIYLNREATNAIVQKLYAEIIAEIAAPYERHVQLLQHVYQYIITHSDEPMPTNVQIARMFYTNRQRLKELFRNLLGTSLYQFYNSTRLDKAHHLINNTHLSLQEIAALCGFSNYHHFSSLFNKHFGYRPSTVARPRGMR